MPFDYITSPVAGTFAKLIVASVGQVLSDSFS